MESTRKPDAFSLWSPGPCLVKRIVSSSKSGDKLATTHSLKHHVEVKGEPDFNLLDIRFPLVHPESGGFASSHHATGLDVVSEPILLSVFFQDSRAYLESQAYELTERYLARGGLPCRSRLTSKPPATTRLVTICLRITCQPADRRSPSALQRRNPATRQQQWQLKTPAAGATVRPQPGFAGASPRQRDGQ